MHLNSCRLQTPVLLRPQHTHPRAGRLPLVLSRAPPKRQSLLSGPHSLVAGHALTPGTQRCCTSYLGRCRRTETCHRRSSLPHLRPPAGSQPALRPAHPAFPAPGSRSRPRPKSPSPEASSPQGAGSPFIIPWRYVWTPRRRQPSPPSHRC